MFYFLEDFNYENYADCDNANYTMRLDQFRGSKYYLEFYKNLLGSQMFYFLEDVHYENYADDSTPYSENKSTGFIANDQIY